MVNKKQGVLIIALISLVFLSSLISAWDIKTTEVSSLSIRDSDMPAIFSLEITNTGNTDDFNLYSVAGVEIEPKESFTIKAGETKTVIMKAYPTVPLKVSPDYYSFEYKLKGASTGTQTEKLVITMVKLSDAFNFYVEDINPDSTIAKVHLQSKYGDSLDNLTLDFSSSFFSGKESFSLNPFEDKVFEINLNTEKVRTLLAGPYIINGHIKFNEVYSPIEGMVMFTEKPGIETTRSSSGWMLRVFEEEKANKGNVKQEVIITTSVNLFSKLFTSINLEPSMKEIKGMRIYYTFRKQLSPNESLDVRVTTNWWILLAVIIGIILVWYFIDKYVKNKIVLRKTVSLVRTKGGEFALKVNINVRARDYCERIRIFDRLPPMVKIFERYGVAMPEKIDEKNRRAEWNIQALGRGEERTLSYIVYSKIGVVGTFELPSAEAIYEFEGKIKEAQSKPAFYSQTK